ncbi:MAG TPA: nuclear transport factor 2 family protein [Anaerolineales bacterium]|nr:nuclear transport factor 2 family protein [Anaerolineales bacterium]
MNTKRLLSTLMILIVTTSLLFTACASAAPATLVKDMSDPVTIVQSFYNSFNAKDLDKAMSLTAEDYVMNDPFGTYDRAGAAVQWQAVMDAGLTFNQTNFVDTGNGRVTSCYEVFENGNSIDKGCGNVTHVQDGKIIFDGLEPAEQIWIVQKYYEALNAKQLDLAMSFIALDALFINPTGTYEGGAAIRESLAGLNTDGITFDLSNFRNTDGQVVYDYKVMQGANLLDQGTNGLTVVKDGKIVFDGTEDTQSASTDPAEVVRGFWAAMNEGDVEAAMAYVAEDAKCKGSCYFTGRQSFQAYLQGYVNSGTVTELGELTIEGDTVRYPFKEFRNGFLTNDNALSESMQIKDGKIIFWENLHI